jgi:hypothetical protein
MEGLCTSKSISRILERVGMNLEIILILHDAEYTTLVEALAIRVTNIVYVGKAGMVRATLLHHISQWICYAIHTVYEVLIYFA